jgi:hypothetical protein
MRPSTFLSCWTLSIALIVAPLGMSHLHVPDHHDTHEQGLVHGGHFHALDVDGASDHGEVIELGGAQQSSSVKQDAPGFVAILLALILMTLGLRPLFRLLRPPARLTEPIHQRACRPPPLRGPPVFSI